MATATRKIFVNWLTKSLQVSDKNGGVIVLPPFQKYEVVPFEVVIVEPIEAVGILKYQRVDIGNLSMAMALNDTLDDASPLAYQNTFAKDETENKFSGDLSLATVGLNTWLGSNASLEAYFEIEIQEGTNISKIYQARVTVRNSVSQVGAIVPSPVDEYYTKAQADAQFDKPIGAAGVQKTITSPGNIYQRILGVTDAGEPIDQIVPV